ncbi:hypothetical protein [Algoriphagus sp.]|uniref:hypothetical protein n=1 Tax=Algoriphagus sp. TaxID=1872435 RepID=UPI003F70FFCB
MNDILVNMFGRNFPKTLSVANYANIVSYFYGENSQLLTIIQLYRSYLLSLDDFIILSKQVFGVTEIVNFF